MDLKKKKALRRIVWNYYRKHGRHDLPWRKTKNPYRILVSEIMLQQTQVNRVIPKYTAFLREFPTTKALADAPQRDVLSAWQGLGYNRRGKALHEAAKKIVRDRGGRMPRVYDELLTLPGVGPYTAGAVCAFAYNTPIGLVETNIRTVVFQHCYANQKKVSDAEILQLSEALLDAKNPREWYWALMDYGAYLKEQGVRNNRQSKHYAKQSKFTGSDREVRGAIIKLLTQHTKLTAREIAEKSKTAPSKVKVQLHALLHEKMIQKKGARWCL